MSRNIAACAGAVLSFVLLLSGCDGDRGGRPVTPVDHAEPARPAQSVATPVRQAGEVVLELSMDEQRVQTNEVGEKVDGAVRAVGKGGALVFGPYLPLETGRYTLIEGASSGPFSVDVMRSAGTAGLAAKGYPSAAGNPFGEGSLAALDFDVAEDTEGVEFRVIVPEGADTSVVSYKVLTR